ncbi:MAG: hypothetical protein IPJ77_23515 [Planctomycetes bacterium]|nr:hypothetical protein [Planctomycetota bacterium]
MAIFHGAPRVASALRSTDLGALRTKPALGATRLALLAATTILATACGSAFGSSDSAATPADAARENARLLVDEGRNTFRFDTFGDEAFWGDVLRLDEAIAGAALGGVGAGLRPRTAFDLGLKLDSTVLGNQIRSDIESDRVDFTDPATTVEFLRRGAVVGVKGFFDRAGNLTSVGITCALCHSTVDDSFRPNMGKRLDGWPNRDLDVGAIIALSPNLAPMSNRLGVDDEGVRAVLRTWGPGKFDAALLLDGHTERPGGGSAATLIPPAFGQGGVNLQTWTGWGSSTYWNAFVANVEMHGQGTFFDPRLDDAQRFPLAASARTGHITPVGEDLVTPKLAALQFYQLALPVPKPTVGSYDPAAAERGGELFRGSAGCATCHVPPLYTEPGWNLHTPEEIGIDDFQASRSPDQRYRTAPLRALFTHGRGGFYHDGRFATLDAVVEHYDQHFSLGLDAAAQHDLVEFLRSL